MEIQVRTRLAEISAPFTDIDDPDLVCLYLYRRVGILDKDVQAYSDEIKALSNYCLAKETIDKSYSYLSDKKTFDMGVNMVTAARAFINMAGAVRSAGSSFNELGRALAQVGKAFERGSNAQS